MHAPPFPPRLFVVPPMSAARRATYQDVLAAPPNQVAEVIDGELHLQPRPAGGHVRVQTRLAQLLAPFDRSVGAPGVGGWIILIEPELHLGEDIVAPDLAGWRRTTMPELELERAFFTQPPDWVCEVLSPRERPQRLKKMDLYLRAGVGHLWHIDPRERTLVVFAREGGAWRTVSCVGGDERVRVDPFAALELELALLWER